MSPWETGPGPWQTEVVSSHNFTVVPVRVKISQGVPYQRESNVQKSQPRLGFPGRAEKLQQTLRYIIIIFSFPDFFHSDFKPNCSPTITSSFTFVSPQGRLTHTTCARTHMIRRDFFDHLRSVFICVFRPFRNQFVPKLTHSWMVGNKYSSPEERL